MRKPPPRKQRMAHLGRVLAARKRLEKRKDAAKRLALYKLAKP